MRTYKLNKENVWLDVSDIENPIELTGDDLAELETIYNAYKPSLGENDTYSLISFDIVLFNGIEGRRMGAYNYMRNGFPVNIILS